MKIKKGDIVQVITGKDKGKQGKVIAVYTRRPSACSSRASTGSPGTPRPASPPAAAAPAAWSSRRPPIHVSNVAVVDPTDKKPTRIKTRVETVERDGRQKATRIRVARALGQGPVRETMTRLNRSGQAAPQGALPRRDQGPAAASSSASTTSCRCPASSRSSSTWVSATPPGRQAHRGCGPRPHRDHRPEAGRHQGPQVHRAVQAARGHADRRAHHAARRPHVGVPRPAASARRCRASVTSAACRRSSSTAVATTPSVSPSSRCSTRSTRTGSTASRGMDITVVTTATNDDEGRALLQGARLPVQGELSMAKTALVNKAEQEAEVRGPRLHPLPALRPSALGLPQVRPVPDLPAGDGPPRRAARRDQVQLVTLG